MEYLTLNEITKRKLEETYVVVYAIKNEMNIKKTANSICNFFIEDVS